MSASAPQTDRSAPMPTPGLPLGPFYPVAAATTCASAEVWRDDASLPAGSRRRCLDGQLIDRRGRPVAGALVEIWHADHQGRYRHPSAPGHEHVAFGFAGYGCTRSDASGRFAFRSLAAAGYFAASVRRAPHVHVQVTDGSDRLVTRMFLPGHPLNRQDRWYQAVARPELLAAHVVHDDEDVLELAWTIVLAHG